MKNAVISTPQNLKTIEALAIHIDAKYASCSETQTCVPANA